MSRPLRALDLTNVAADKTRIQTQGIHARKHGLVNRATDRVQETIAVRKVRLRGRVSHNPNLDREARDGKNSLSLSQL